MWPREKELPSPVTTGARTPWQKCISYFLYAFLISYISFSGHTSSNMLILEQKRSPLGSRWAHSHSLGRNCHVAGRFTSIPVSWWTCGERCCSGCCRWSTINCPQRSLGVPAGHSSAAMCSSVHSHPTWDEIHHSGGKKANLPPHNKWCGDLCSALGHGLRVLLNYLIKQNLPSWEAMVKKSSFSLAFHTPQC